MSHVGRVGLILVVGAVVFSGIFYLLSGRYAQRNSYSITVVFDNALGLQYGSKVRMAGVDIGMVADVGLTPDNRARLRLNIDKKYGIPEGSRFTIATGALIGEKFLEILPARSSRLMEPETIVQGPQQVQKPFQIEEVGTEVNKLLADLQKIAKSLDTILSNRDLQRGVVETVTNLARTTARTERLIAEAQEVVLRNQSQVDQTMANLAQASIELRAAIAEVHGVVKRPDLQENVVETAAALRTASERLDAVVQDVRDITSDPDVSRNLRESAQNLSEATAHARDVGERVSRFLGSGQPKITVNLPKPKLQSGSRFVIEAAGSGSGNTRTDVIFTLPTGQNTGLRLGLYDFTEADKIIAQRVHWVDPKTAMRYGIFGGHPGVGMDYDISRKFSMSADLYHPKYPRLDVRGRYFLTKDLGTVFGVDGILRQPRAIVGIQWRQ
ncbi:MAG TPA: MlaD family protein [Armatimonadota bacterium]|nr:MlaD family protein [Armatimonadota bacterium]HPO72744.1 MlaD family protein [Armatimonadota bacterium]